MSVPDLPDAPSAERNKAPILEVLRGALPAAGRVLELASGTGQHVVHFAAALPGLRWQPTERDPDRLAGIAARVAAAGLANVEPPRPLDALARPWDVTGPFDALLAINLVHISPWEVTLALFAEAPRLLAGRATDRVVLYGAYREGGRHSAPSNEAFDGWLKAQDARWGVRDLEAVTEVARAQGFAAPVITRMPANNLALVFARAA